MCWISYGKLTQIDKQSHNSTFSTLPHGDHALSGHAQKYHDCSLLLAQEKIQITEIISQEKILISKHLMRDYEHVLTIVNQTYSTADIRNSNVKICKQKTK